MTQAQMNSHSREWLLRFVRVWALLPTSTRKSCCEALAQFCAERANKLVTDAMNTDTPVDSHKLAAWGLLEETALHLGGV